jgi:hypothetical protein
MLRHIVQRLKRTKKKRPPSDEGRYTVTSTLALVSPAKWYLKVSSKSCRLLSNDFLLLKGD